MRQAFLKYLLMALAAPLLLYVGWWKFWPALQDVFLQKQHAVSDKAMKMVLERSHSANYWEVRHLEALLMEESISPDLIREQKNILRMADSLFLADDQGVERISNDYLSEVNRLCNVERRVVQIPSWDSLSVVSRPWALCHVVDVEKDALHYLNRICISVPKQFRCVYLHTSPDTLRVGEVLSVFNVFMNEHDGDQKFVVMKEDPSVKKKPAMLYWSFVEEMPASNKPFILWSPKSPGIYKLFLTVHWKQEAVREKIPPVSCPYTIHVLP